MDTYRTLIKVCYALHKNKMLKSAESLTLVELLFPPFKKKKEKKVFASQQMVFIKIIDSKWGLFCDFFF